MCFTFSVRPSRPSGPAWVHLILLAMYHSMRETKKICHPSWTGWQSWHTAATRMGKVKPGSRGVEPGAPNEPRTASDGRTDANLLSGIPMCYLVNAERVSVWASITPRLARVPSSIMPGFFGAADVILSCRQTLFIEVEDVPPRWIIIVDLLFFPSHHAWRVINDSAGHASGRRGNFEWDGMKMLSARCAIEKGETSPC